MMKNLVTATTIITALHCISTPLVAVNGFTSTTATRGSRQFSGPYSPTRTSHDHTRLNLFGFGGGGPGGDFEFPPLMDMLPQGELPSFLSELPKLLGGESAAAAPVECLEECAVNEATHAMLDFEYGDVDNKTILKALKVVGNLVVLQQSATHLQDVLKDELLFQIGFLGLATLSLYNTIAPKIKASQHPTALLMTPQDRLAYRKLFKPAGFSWMQFRELSIGSGAMEWVTVEAGEVIDEEAAFWLYEGDVDVVYCSEDDEDHLCNMEGRHEGSLLGEEHLLSMLHGTSTLYESETPGQDKTYIAGMEGATYLRLDNDSLQARFKYDEDLSTSIRRMCYTAMKNKMNGFQNKAEIAAAAKEAAAVAQQKVANA